MNTTGCARSSGSARPWQRDGLRVNSESPNLRRNGNSSRDPCPLSFPAERVRQSASEPTSGRGRSSKKRRGISYCSCSGQSAPRSRGDPCAISLTHRQRDLAARRREVLPRAGDTFDHKNVSPCESPISLREAFVAGRSITLHMLENQIPSVKRLGHMRDYVVWPGCEQSGYSPRLPRF
jgi:hypothetical protein